MLEGTCKGTISRPLLRSWCPGHVSELVALQVTAQPSMGWQTAWISSTAVHLLYFAFLCVACWLFRPSQQAAQHCELQELAGMPLRQRRVPHDSCLSHQAMCCHSQHHGWLASAVDSMQRLCPGLQTLF